MGPPGTLAVIACESCGHYLLSEGGRSATPLRDTDYGVVARSFRDPVELASLAAKAGWNGSGDSPTRWLCPQCFGGRK